MTWEIIISQTFISGTGREANVKILLCKFKDHMAKSICWMCYMCIHVFILLTYLIMENVTHVSSNFHTGSFAH